MLDCDESKHIGDYLEQSKCIYFPYLGKNDHPADIKNVKRLSVSNVSENKVQISSLFFRNIGDTVELEEDDDIDVVRYCEKLPIALNPYTNLYEYQDFCYTNVSINVKNGNLYKCENDILQFF